LKNIKKGLCTRTLLKCKKARKATQNIPELPPIHPDRENDFEEFIDSQLNETRKADPFHPMNGQLDLFGERKAER